MRVLSSVEVWKVVNKVTAGMSVGLEEMEDLC